MTRQIVCICSMILLFLTKDNALLSESRYQSFIKPEINMNLNLTSMEALELVKEKYADNFEKASYEQAEEDNQGKGIGEELYYYKLPDYEYYLVYEGQGETKNDYLFHLYEFVLDDLETGIGHTVTYGWYNVNKKTGKITDTTQ